MNITKSDQKILGKIAAKSGLKEFWLGGSLTYLKPARDIGVTFRSTDYDLAIEGGRGTYEATRKSLEENSFDIIKSRTYYLKFNKAFQIVARKGSMHLDIAIVNDLSHLAHFNIESIFWHFPSGMLYDPYNSLDAIKQKRLIPIISHDAENPFILTSRFVKLCARFDIDFVSDKNLYPFARKLARATKEWNTTDPFHGTYAKGHAYFGMLQAMLRAKEKDIFIGRLQQSGLLSSIFPEVGQMLRVTGGHIKGLRAANTPKQVVNCLTTLLRDDERGLRTLNQRIKLTSNRLRIKNAGAHY